MASHDALRRSLKFKLKLIMSENKILAQTIEEHIRRAEAIYRDTESLDKIPTKVFKRAMARLETAYSACIKLILLATDLFDPKEDEQKHQQQQQLPQQPSAQLSQSSSQGLEHFSASDSERTMDKDTLRRLASLERNFKKYLSMRSKEASEMDLGKETMPRGKFLYQRMLAGPERPDSFCSTDPVMELKRFLFGLECQDNDGYRDPRIILSNERKKFPYETAAPHAARRLNRCETNLAATDLQAAEGRAGSSEDCGCGDVQIYEDATTFGYFDREVDENNFDPAHESRERQREFHRGMNVYQKQSGPCRESMRCAHKFMGEGLDTKQIGIFHITRSPRKDEANQEREIESYKATRSPCNCMYAPAKFQRQLKIPSCLSASSPPSGGLLATNTSITTAVLSPIKKNAQETSAYQHKYLDQHESFHPHVSPRQSSSPRREQVLQSDTIKHVHQQQKCENKQHILQNKDHGSNIAMTYYPTPASHERRGGCSPQRRRANEKADGYLRQGRKSVSPLLTQENEAHMRMKLDSSPGKPSSLEMLPKMQKQSPLRRHHSIKQQTCLPEKEKKEVVDTETGPKVSDISCGYEEVNMDQDQAHLILERIENMERFLESEMSTERSLLGRCLEVFQRLLGDTKPEELFKNVVRNGEVDIRTEFKDEKNIIGDRSNSPKRLKESDKAFEADGVHLRTEMKLKKREADSQDVDNEIFHCSKDEDSHINEKSASTKDRDSQKEPINFENNASPHPCSDCDWEAGDRRKVPYARCTVCGGGLHDLCVKRCRCTQKKQRDGPMTTTSCSFTGVWADGVDFEAGPAKNAGSPLHVQGDPQMVRDDVRQKSVKMKEDFKAAKRGSSTRGGTQPPQCSPVAASVTSGHQDMLSSHTHRTNGMKLNQEDFLNMVVERVKEQFLTAVALCDSEGKNSRNSSRGGDELKAPASNDSNNPHNEAEVFSPSGSHKDETERPRVSSAKGFNKKLKQADQTCLNTEETMDEVDSEIATKRCSKVDDLLDLNGPLPAGIPQPVSPEKKNETLPRKYATDAIIDFSNMITESLSLGHRPLLPPPPPPPPPPGINDSATDNLPFAGKNGDGAGNVNSEYTAPPPSHPQMFQTTCLVWQPWTSEAANIQGSTRDFSKQQSNSGEIDLSPQRKPARILGQSAVLCGTPNYQPLKTQVQWTWGGERQNPAEITQDYVEFQKQQLQFPRHFNTVPVAVMQHPSEQPQTSYRDPQEPGFAPWQSDPQSENCSTGVQYQPRNNAESVYVQASMSQHNQYATHELLGPTITRSMHTHDELYEDQYINAYYQENNLQEQQHQAQPLPPYQEQYHFVQFQDRQKQQWEDFQQLQQARQQAMDPYMHRQYQSMKQQRFPELSELQYPGSQKLQTEEPQSPLVREKSEMYHSPQKPPANIPVAPNTCDVARSGRGGSIFMTGSCPMTTVSHFAPGRSLEGEPQPLNPPFQQVADAEKTLLGAYADDDNLALLESGVTVSTCRPPGATRSRSRSRHLPQRFKSFTQPNLPAPLSKHFVEKSDNYGAMKTLTQEPGCQTQPALETDKDMSENVKKTLPRRSMSQGPSCGRTKGENRTVCITNLPSQLEEMRLLKMLNDHGYVSKIYFIKHRSSGDFQGTAYVKFRQRLEAESAVRALNQLVLDGRHIAATVMSRKTD